MQMDNNYFYAESNKAINYNIHVGYNLTGNLQSIIDTNYESSSMGINITLQDATGNIVSSSMLVGTRLPSTTFKTIQVAMVSSVLNYRIKYRTYRKY